MHKVSFLSSQLVLLDYTSITKSELLCLKWLTTLLTKCKAWKLEFLKIRMLCINLWFWIMINNKIPNLFLINRGTICELRRSLTPWNSPKLPLARNFLKTPLLYKFLLYISNSHFPHEFLGLSLPKALTYQIQFIPVLIQEL